MREVERRVYDVFGQHPGTKWEYKRSESLSLLLCLLQTSPILNPLLFGLKSFLTPHSKHTEARLRYVTHDFRIDHYSSLDAKSLPQHQLD